MKKKSEEKKKHAKKANKKHRRWTKSPLNLTRISLCVNFISSLYFNSQTDFWRLNWFEISCDNYFLMFRWVSLRLTQRKIKSEFHGHSAAIATSILIDRKKNEMKQISADKKWAQRKQMRKQRNQKKCARNIWVFAFASIDDWIAFIARCLIKFEPKKKKKATSKLKREKENRERNKTKRRKEIRFFSLFGVVKCLCVCRNGQSCKVSEKKRKKKYWNKKRSVASKYKKCLSSVEWTEKVASVKWRFLQSWNLNEENWQRRNRRFTAAAAHYQEHQQRQ